MRIEWLSVVKNDCSRERQIPAKVIDSEEEDKSKCESKDFTTFSTGRFERESIHENKCKLGQRRERERKRERIR